LLIVSFNFLFFSIFLDDSFGQSVILYILAVAGSEVSIGLSFLILLFRVKGILNLDFYLGLKG
jgi:NADH:ubiquinone oxidoreductase subunit K